MSVFEEGLAKLAKQIKNIAEGLAKHETRIKALEKREPHGDAIKEGGNGGRAPDDGGS